MKPLVAEVKPYVDLGVRVPAKGKWYLKLKQGYEFFRNTGRWHRRTRIMDRRNNWYYEHIEDAETDKLIRHKNHRLTEHRSEREIRKVARD